MAASVPLGILAEWDRAIEMDDGVTLRADVFRPDTAVNVPVIMNQGPYGKGLHPRWGYPDLWAAMVADNPELLNGSSGELHSWEVVDPEYWVPRGYAVVRVDARGSGRSEGYLDPFSPREIADFRAAIEWAGAEPWSNGRVGLAGTSYLAASQWHVAATRPPHLAAICPWEGWNDFYREFAFHGGIPAGFVAGWFTQQPVRVQHGVGEWAPRNPHTLQLVAGDRTAPPSELRTQRIDLVSELAQHPLDGDFYRNRSADLERIEVPVLEFDELGWPRTPPSGPGRSLLAGRVRSRSGWRCTGTTTGDSFSVTTDGSSWGRSSIIS